MEKTCTKNEKTDVHLYYAKRVSVFIYLFFFLKPCL